MTENTTPDENEIESYQTEWVPEEPVVEGVFEPVEEKPVEEKIEVPPPYKSSKTYKRKVRPKKASPPLRFVFGDMWGVIFLIWVPVIICFFLPWHLLIPDTEIIGNLKYHQAIFGLVIALPPWIVLIVHLTRGRLLDGILDMFLWAIWECFIMILLCFLYPDVGSDVIWNGSGYWEEMRGWLATGEGIEGDPGQWLYVHAKHLIMLVIGALVFGLPALVMGVFQLNYMNYYVARCMLLSDNPLITLLAAWHFWSILRVAGYIILASTFFQAVLRLIFRTRWSGGAFAGGLVTGLLFMVADGIFKWLYAEHVRELIAMLTGL